MTPKETPMQKQYREIKSKHPDCIIFFHLGDFYEMFYEDARKAAAVLDLALTSRGTEKGGKVPMCGIPCHAADNYLGRLVRAGFRVAVCEQVEDASAAKGLVKREVTRIVSAGTLLEEGAADTRYLAAFLADGRNCGIAFVDPSEGHIQANQYQDYRQAAEVLARLSVAEYLHPETDGHDNDSDRMLDQPLLREKQTPTSTCPPWYFNPEMSRNALCEHFRTAGLEGFGLEGKPLAVSCAGALLHYLSEMNRRPVRHLDRLSLYSDDQHLYLPEAACRGLEIDSLVEIMDRTMTAPGRRLLRYCVYHPLKDRKQIEARQEAVTLLVDETAAREKLSRTLRHLPDAERALSRIGSGYTSARDLLALAQALGRRKTIEPVLAGLRVKNSLFEVRALPEMENLLESAINPEMPLSDPAGRTVKAGYDEELDELRTILENAHAWLSDFQARERKRTGINSLKVGYNRIFGYYLEISRANLDSAPPDYQRKQTLVNGERFTLPELVDFEHKMLTARQRVMAREEELLSAIRRRILDNSPQLHAFSRDIARVDLMLCFSLLAVEEKNYVRPRVTDRDTIKIQKGRHPVVEKMTEKPFVPNDVLLDHQENRLLVLTGPNMAGKSTWIRQVAVLVIMAQAGSRIPAEEAEIGLVDRLFTRIGARDEISRGQSTFMVEMNETAGILNHLTPRSLVILDEIGRGTSTYDGLSLAWAVAEHLQASGVRTLFATHFHELTALADNFSGARNYNVAVRKWRDEVVFLHRIEPGGTDDSYGINVARLAGVPEPVLERAADLLEELEAENSLRQKIRGNTPAGNRQVSLFPDEGEPETGKEKRLAEEFNRLKELEAEIASLPVDSMTPLEALGRINRWQKKIKGQDEPD